MKTKFERLLCQGDQEGRGSTGWSRGTDKHAPMYSPLQVVANPCSLAVAFFYRGMFRSHVGSTCGIECYVWNWEKYVNPQTALCPRFWRVRQPAHWSGGWKSFFIPRSNPLLKVCYRGLLTTLLCTPYEGKEGWEVTAARWRGTIYLRQQVSCQTKLLPGYWEKAMFVFGTGDGREKKAERARDWTPEDDEFLGVIFVLDNPLRQTKWFISWQV